MTTRTRARRASGRRGLVLVACAAGLLTAAVATNSTRWIGTTFPGFLLMANRVVPSIALPDWEAASAETIFQHEVIALDDVPVASASDVYRRVAASPVGTVHRYRIRSTSGEETVVAARARRFSGVEYGLLFGVYLSTGLAFFLTGIIVAWLKRGPASRALLVQCLTTGVFVVTAADLYGPHWFFRLHVIAESMLAAGFIHLALVFPTDRLPRRRGLVLFAVYLPFALLAAAYELSLTTPATYTAVHLMASASHGIGALAIIFAVGWDLATTRSPLVRRRVGVVTLGTLVAFALPGALMAASALLGGRVPLNAGAFTAFVFPLSLGYAIVKQDLFEIDVLLRRAVTYAVAIAAITITYLAVLALLGVAMPLQSLSPVAMAALNLGILFLMAPMKARVRDAVDHVFYRRAYDAERELAELSHALSAAYAYAEVERHTLQVVGQALHPVASEILLSDDGVSFLRGGNPGHGHAVIELSSDLAPRLSAGAILARYQWDDAGAGPVPEFWRILGAEILVPIRSGQLVIGALSLGRKASGHAYNDDDGRFLAAAASQIGLAIVNARAFGQLAELNANLEDQVRERTAALEIANDDLNRSYAAMQSAFRQLEQSQTSLMRADRLATLGRLTAGIAHEVNTPLGAVLNALQILGDLGREYQESIDDGTVTTDDHREIAREITTTADNATGWARKAAAFITRVKTHGREPHPASRQRFTVRSVVEETRALLAQRLRLECCDLVFEEEPADVSVVGDPTRLGQVLVNLVNNALDAYEEGRVPESRIVVGARAEAGEVVVTVRDWAGGMPADVVARIFDELFTTKDPGRGTGLGLSISRNLVETAFGGSLTVASDVGIGSCFSIALPERELDAPDAPIAVAS